MGIVALLALVGCDSTQNKNARAKLTAQREIARRKPLRLDHANPHVRVTSAALVRGRRSSAVVVGLESSAPRPETDVPISVAARLSRGRIVRLNARAGLDWFETHVPAVPAHGRTTWVFTMRRRLPRGARALVRVGAVPSPPVSQASSLPQIDSSPAGAPRRRAVTVRVENASDVPQYGIQVYALVGGGGRWRAAGRAALEHLGTGQTKTVAVPLTGRTTGGRLRLRAVPTIFE